MTIPIESNGILQPLQGPVASTEVLLCTLQGDGALNDRSLFVTSPMMLLSRSLGLLRKGEDMGEEKSELSSELPILRDDARKASTSSVLDVMVASCAIG